MCRDPEASADSRFSRRSWRGAGDDRHPGISWWHGCRTIEFPRSKRSYLPCLGHFRTKGCLREGFLLCHEAGTPYHHRAVDHVTGSQLVRRGRQCLGAGVEGAGPLRAPSGNSTEAAHTARHRPTQGTRWVVPAAGAAPAVEPGNGHGIQHAPSLLRIARLQVRLEDRFQHQRGRLLCILVPAARHVRRAGLLGLLRWDQHLPGHQ